MRISRRQLLKATAAGSGTLFLTDVRGGARAQSAPPTGPFFISVEAQNGWDPTFLTDPKVDAAFTPWIAQDVRTATGTTISYAPHIDTAGVKSVYRVGADAQDFFQKHGSKLLVINGVDNATVSHDVGPRVAFAGSNREGIPTLAGLYAAARGSSLPLSLMTTGGFLSSAGLVPVTRAGNVEVLLGLARSNEANFTAAPSNRRLIHADGAMALLRERVRLRDARRAALAGGVPRELAGIFRLSATRSADMFRQYDALADALDEAAAVTSTNRVIPKAASVLAAMKAGACVAAHLETEETFDTHSDHDDNHPGSMQHLLEIVDFLIDTVANDPVLAARGALIVVGSDFGRTKYNEEGGKDHWPITSMFITGVGAAATLIDGGRVVGASETTLPGGGAANGIVALKVKESGGDVVLTEDDDPAGFSLSAGHVHLALREALGLTDDDVTRRFPLTSVLPQAPLPLLKRS